MPKKFSFRYEYFMLSMALIVLIAISAVSKWYYVMIVHLILLVFFMIRWLQATKKEILDG